MNNISIREYTTHDKNEVLNLLRLNTPAYFAPEEEKDLTFYLENEIEQYFVLEVDGVVVGCGGINFSKDKSTGTISWDILHPDFQKKSLGSVLLNHRIERLKQVKEVKTIVVRTSQLAYGFYEKQGFKLLDVVKDYWAKGFDLYNMEYIQ